MLFNMISECDYYYISITPGSDSKLSLGKVHNNGIYHVLAVNDTKTFDFDTGTNHISYILRVNVINGDGFRIYINDILMIEYIDITSSVNGGVLSGYIGIMNKNLNTIFRSLHISGSEWIYDSVSLNICNIPQYQTLSPTKEPTYNPTVYPTYIPSVYPTNIPTNIPTISPTKYPTLTTTNIPSMEPTYYPTTEPTIEPTNHPTTNPIELESGSVDEDISTTNIQKTNGKKDEW